MSVRIGSDIIRATGKGIGARASFTTSLWTVSADALVRIDQGLIDSKWVIWSNRQGSIDPNSRLEFVLPDDSVPPKDGNGAADDSEDTVATNSPE